MRVAARVMALWLGSFAGAFGDCITYAPITGAIISATFETNFAALVAHPDFFGIPVNHIDLRVPGFTPLDLTAAIFGNASFPDAPLLDMGLLDTRVISVPIPESFFPALIGGMVGYSITVTDTDDGMFAIDYFAIKVQTASGSREGYLDEPNGFGIGVPLNGDLSGPLPDSIPAASGSGFDETISSKGIHYEVPEPAPFLLTGIALAAFALRKRGCRVLTGVALAATIHAAPKINEVMYWANTASADPKERLEWIEIDNTGPPMSLGGWTVSDRGGRLGAAARALPPVLLPTGARLVVYFGTGTNDYDFSDGSGAHYTGDSAGANLLGNTMDEAALYSGSAIFDFVAWNRTETGYLRGIAHNEAVVAGIWPRGAFVQTGRIQHSIEQKTRQIGIGESMVRDESEPDRNSSEDWDESIARTGSKSTAGLPNAATHLLIPQLDTRTTNRRKWTVMFYLSNDIAEDHWAFQDLKKMQEPPPSFSTGGADVNVVAMVDTKRALTEGVILNGIATVARPTPGGAYRFRIEPQADPRHLRMLNRAADPAFLGEVNMGDPATLSGFIQWAAANYPADNYAIVLSSHGKGWKVFGPDETEFDGFHMEELRTAFRDGGVHFRVIGFDACMMAMIEVAYQIQPYGDHYIAHQQTTAGSGWPHGAWLGDLKQFPQLDGEALSRAIADRYNQFYGTTEINRERTVSIVRLANLPQLVNRLSLAAGDLRRGVDDFRTHDTPFDNVQYHLYLHSIVAARFHDDNYMDLRQFAQLVKDDKDIPECYKTHLSEVLRLLSIGGGVMLAESHGPAYPDNGIGGRLGGLSVYMPQSRTYRSYGDLLTNHNDQSYSSTVLEQQLANVTDLIGLQQRIKLALREPYDYPVYSYETSLFDRRAMYSFNNDLLPDSAEEIENKAPLGPPPEWPLVPSPNFLFTRNTEWDEFLLRYYHPVADNHILRAVGPGGAGSVPVFSYPACGNPVDRITIMPGWTVFFSGAGSSDIDHFAPPTPNGLRPQVVRARHWMWDFDDRAKGCGTCVAPYEVGAGIEASAANDDMDAERLKGKAPLNDEKDIDREKPSWVIKGLHDRTVTLNAWDENHTYLHHDTLPDATYTHPQTDDHISTIEIGEAVTQVHISGPNPNRIGAGSSGSITASAQSGTTPVPGIMLAFTKMQGNFSFTAGSVSTDGKESRIFADAEGKAAMSFKIDGAGPAAVKVSVVGAAPAAYSVFYGQ